MNRKYRKSDPGKRPQTRLPITLNMEENKDEQHYVMARELGPGGLGTTAKRSERGAGKMGNAGSDLAPQSARPIRQSVVADVGGPDQVVVAGYRSQSVLDWIHVELGGREAWIKRKAFGGQAREADAILAASGIVLIGAGARGKLLAAVAQITGFEPRSLIERPGWTGAIYAFPDRTLYPKRARQTATAVFTVDHARMVPAGTDRAWREEVAAPLAGLDLASFVIMMPFAALLRDLVDAQLNQGFELVGPPGCGKSTLQQLAASVVGRPAQPDPYWINLDTTIAGLEIVMNDHRDLPLILDEANHYLLSLSEGERPAKMALLAFKLESAQAKRRKPEPVRDPPSRFNYLISSNDSIASMAQGSRSEGIKAACDRLLSLIIEEDAAYGAFESLPDGWASSHALATSVLAAGVRNHGHPFRTFTRRLAMLRATDETELRRRVAEHLATFRAYIGIDENDGSAVRVADAFGLVAAAGLAGVAFGVLPRSFRPIEAAAACYRRNRGIAISAPPAERLKRYMNDNDLPEVDRSRRLAMSRAEWKRSPGAVLIDRDGERLFVIAPSAFRRAFADHRSLIADRTLQDRMLNESGRSGINKRVRRDGTDRVLCWRAGDL